MHNEVELPPQKKQKRGSATDLTDKQLLCTIALGNLTPGNVSAALKQAKAAGEVSLCPQLQAYLPVWILPAPSPYHYWAACGSLQIRSACAGHERNSGGTSGGRHCG